MPACDMAAETLRVEGTWNPGFFLALSAVHEALERSGVRGVLPFLVRLGMTFPAADRTNKMTIGGRSSVSCGNRDRGDVGSKV